jgi:hypothetical protein
MKGERSTSLQVLELGHLMKIYALLNVTYNLLVIEFNG